MSESGITFKGQKIEELTKEELIEAVVLAYQTIQRLQKEKTNILDIWMRR